MALSAKLLRLLILPLFLVIGTSAMAQDDATAETGATELQTLIDVLENDTVRADLIERLKAEAAPEEADIPDIIDPSSQISVARKVAQFTQDAAQSAANGIQDVLGAIDRLPDIFGGLSGLNAAFFIESFGELLVLFVGTVAIFYILRRIAMLAFRRLNSKVERSSTMMKIVIFIISLIIDLLLVVVATAFGYALAVLALGEVGQIGIRQTLFLNAFWIVGVIRVGVRMILSPAAGQMRLLPMKDDTATGLNAWVSLMVSLVGYGQLLLVPVVNQEVSYAAGSALTAFIALLVLAFAVIMVLRNRTKLADWLTGDQGIVRKRGGLGWLARHWHWPVLAYLFAMFIIVLASPPNLVFSSLATSGQVVLVVLAGVALSTFLTRVMQNGIQIPASTRDRLPLLETRLNRFVPKALAVLRFIIVAFVILFALNAINLVSFTEWLSSEMGLRFTGKFISVTLILLVAFAIWVALTSFVDYRLNPQYGTIATSREQTLLSLARNAGTITLLIITLMFVLAEIGLNIAPLLASAGVLGLAIGFGAQKFVQDIITGLFIQFENAFNVGDVITVGGITGTVERLTIRSVSLRDVSGVYHIIPFSSVDMVSNYMRDFGYFLCDMGVAYRENVDEVKVAMTDAFDELRAGEAFGGNVIGDFEWFGVQALADSAVILRARIKCIPGTQWGVGREYNEICKRIFDERGIEIPFPHQTLFLGESKDGKTQTFNVSGRTQIEGRVGSLSEPDETKRRDVDDARTVEPAQDAPLDDGE
ncbi:Moderate conductance mechanosensitive channel YbiO precursor [Rhodobacteraceae bacterium THAF1]|uniref:mechanosensitive ion channel domain-containing protein n=1 Tax=Palleronia sp. THAF1 TaxID=2587842 RepID=UPI000F3F7BC1|nr:mechanosensitive ion channel domain-containing protein [Palleronia sp. THAF1]QFU09765.1 Moderate conductance mechanosensitive channel YbiO precursor [Palleronia sp. THAF1]VDC17332.1 Moderate conductance mechanosensitive channel YbiO precursor [Rhodobacteraceae bacterium THAF1]